MLRRHLRLPSLHGLEFQALFRERGIDGGDDVVYALKTEALTVFAGRGEFPGDFPGGYGLVGWCCDGGWAAGEYAGGALVGRKAYHRRPPSKLEVALKGPNILWA